MTAVSAAAPKILNRLPDVKSVRDGSWVARCPAHDDKNPSLAVSESGDGRVLLHCRAGCDHVAVLAALGLEEKHLWPDGWGDFEPATPRPTAPAPAAGRPKSYPFGPDKARALLGLAFARAKEGRVDATLDPEVWSWLAGRNLDEAFVSPTGEYLEAFGVLGPGAWERIAQPIHDCLRWRGHPWRETGHWVVAPLFDTATGELVGLESRSVRDDLGEVDPALPKCLPPIGSRKNRTVFATKNGRLALRGEWAGSKIVIVGEGLTDSLALAAAMLPFPGITVPGAALAGGALGSWARGWTVIAALDGDEAGRRGAAALQRRAREVGAAEFGVLPLPEGADLADMLRSLGPVRLSKFVKEAVQ